MGVLIGTGSYGVCRSARVSGGMSCQRPGRRGDGDDRRYSGDSRDRAVYPLDVLVVCAVPRLTTTAYFRLEQQGQHGGIVRTDDSRPMDARHLAGLYIRQRRTWWRITYRSRPASCQAFFTGESRYSMTVRRPSRISAVVCMPTDSGYFTPSVSSALASRITSAL